MREVAAWKRMHGAPVEDLIREEQVIAAAVDAGLRLGFRPEGSARFFRVQIEAAKDIQRYWIQHWQSGEAGDAPVSAADLNDALRPRLNALGDAILLAMAAGRLHHDEAEFHDTVALPGLGAQRRRALFAALTEMRRFESRLEQILETGMLRVGTTGDYAPFSHSLDGVRYEGIDIDLAADLAAALGVKLELVPSSWPTLMADLEAGRYDLAMSGVSRTTDRARTGYFSAPYHVGGKQPIARCTDGARFASMEGIDQPGVRVIVNPGGTNEAFVDARIKRANKLLHPDNRTIFAALTLGEADVMITDSIEVAVQTRKNPALCAPMADLLTYQEKGFLMPQDPALKAYVDLWLDLRLGDGTVRRLIDEHLTD